MKLKDEIFATGSLKITRTNSQGKVVEVVNVKNLVVSVGRNYIASRMIGTAEPVMSHMAIGTGTDAASPTDTLLGSEAGRVTLSSATNSTNTTTYTATFPAGTGTGAITEAGIFNAGVAGVMLARTVFPVVNKAAGDSIAISWSVAIN